MHQRGTLQQRVRVLNLAAYKRGTSYASTRKQSTRVLVSNRLYCVLWKFCAFKRRQKSHLSARWRSNGARGPRINCESLSTVVFDVNPVVGESLKRKNGDRSIDEENEFINTIHDPRRGRIFRRSPAPFVTIRVGYERASVRVAMEK